MNMDSEEVGRIRKDFPILKRKVNGKPLVYLDNAATTQKPRQVIDAVSAYYASSNSNVHRGVHALSEEATEAYESARKAVADFIGAESADEIIFVRNATEAINLFYYAYAARKFGRGDRLVKTMLEHHSNFVPWQQLARSRGVEEKIVNVKENFTLDYDGFEKYAAGGRTKLIAVSHVSNSLGTLNDIRRIKEIAEKHDSIFLLDACQSVPHLPVDVGKLGCDFMAFSGHKMLAPMGIGVAWCRRELLERFEPFMFGGDMILKVGLKESEWNTLPYKFEAGTPNVEGALGLHAAINYLKKIGLEKIHHHGLQLANQCVSELELLGVKTYSPPKGLRSGIVSFTVPGVHPHDIATLLDREGIAVRSGHLCTQPLMKALGVPAVTRASFYIYNTKEEVGKLIAALKSAQSLFSLEKKKPSGKKKLQEM